jgi:DeoR/GlpR family transcriptional regulator of sugar metabolism
MKRNRLLAEERRRHLLQRVREEGVVATSALATDYDVSEMTIRNDLSRLASQGHLERIHGGAVARRWLSREPSYIEKAHLQPEAKEAIGREAARMIDEGMVVFIGNGTTTMEIIRNLPSDRHVHVFTNSLNHATELANRANIELSVIGGHVRAVSLAMIGPLVHRALEGIYFDLAFFGANGVSIDYGVSIPSLEEAEVAAEIIKRSKRTVVTADHTKLEVITHGKIADLSAIGTLITDKIPDPTMPKRLKRLSVDVVLAATKGR